MNNSDEEKIQTNEEVLQQLNELSVQMESQPIISEEHLRNYVGLYVRRHSLSQDFFGALCEHTIIQKLFGSPARNIPSVTILEIFNLLLANTSQQNNLIFIFSQTSLHEYLFDRFNPFTDCVEAVEYYVQLLKTIILKISSQGNNSLIKLFCNNRYSSFPLLSVAITLATAYSQEELVRVTASQCVLQLIALINEKHVGRGYLTDLQIVVFFYEITCRLREESEEEGHLKYLIDLLYALRNNPTSISLLFSAFTNNVIMPLLHNLPAILKTLRKFDELITDHGGFPEAKYRSIRRVLLNIISTFYFAKFMNSTYMASLKLLIFEKLPQPNLLKYYQKRGEKIGDFLLEFDSKTEAEEVEEMFLLYEGWADFNYCSEEIQKIKDGKIKTKGKGLFGSLFSKTSPQQQYIQRALTSIGINYEQLRRPLFKLSLSLNMKTGVYFVEEALTKREERGELIDRYKLEAHISDFKGKFDLSEDMCLQVLYMVEKLQRQKVLLKEENNKCPTEVQFEYRFLLKLRNYLVHTLSDYLLIVEKELSLRAIAVIRLVITKLGVFPLLDRKIRQKLAWKLEEVQQEINDHTFADDFRKLIGYIINNKEEQFLQLFDQNKNPTSPNFNSIELKAFKYEFLRKIIDPSLESISEYVNREWCQAMSKHEIASLTYNFTYLETGSLCLKPTNLGIIIHVKLSENEKQFTIKVKQDDPKISSKNKSCLQFRQLAFLLQMRDKDEASILRANIERIRSFREERITKLIIQYFEATYNKIKDSVYKVQKVKK